MPKASVLPEIFLERLKRIFSEDLYPEILKSFEISRPVIFRQQRLDFSPSQTLQRLKEDSLPVELLQESPFAVFRLEKDFLRKFQEHPLYKEGSLYIQGLSSMLVPLALDPQPGERVLDLTAAPGSKTTLIALLMRGEGELTANDHNRTRFFKMKAILENQGFPHVKTMMRPGEAYGREAPETYDRVLLDAPCSSEARFQAFSRESLGFWKLMKVRLLAKKQKRLLLSAFSALKPGGVLVYSTCTFAPEENEGVIAGCLKKFGAAAQVESFSLPLVQCLQGLESWGRETFPEELKETKRIIPDARTEGFYIARLRKVSSWQWRSFKKEKE